VKKSKKKFEVIIESYGIKKQKTLMKYLYENIKNNTKIICRHSSNFENNKQDFNYLFKMFEIKNKIKTDVFGPMFSYYMIKKRNH